jgi:hypothetical protein
MSTSFVVTPGEGRIVRDGETVDREKAAVE